MQQLLSKQKIYVISLYLHSNLSKNFKTYYSILILSCVYSPKSASELSVRSDDKRRVRSSDVKRGRVLIIPPATVETLCSRADAVGDSIPRSPDTINAELKPIMNR